jgi:hypothetical protein
MPTYILLTVYFKTKFVQVIWQLKRIKKSEEMLVHFFNTLKKFSLPINLYTTFKSEFI